MRPTDILGTTSVRLGSLFLALFGAASLALFGFMHWQTHGFMTARTDEWLVREQGIFGPLAPTELAERLEQHAAEDPYLERPFTLFDATGRRITGSAIAKPPMTALGHAADFEAPWQGRTAPFRGLMQRLPSGDLLLVAQDVRAQHEFDERLTSAMLWGGLGAAVIGVAGSVAAGIGAVRRLDALTRAIQRTVAGGLSSRLPVQGAGGDMARLVHVVNRMLDDIERLMHEVKGVCDNIAHDLRTPLSRLLAGLERVSRRRGAVEAYQAAVDEAIDDVKSLDAHRARALLGARTQLVAITNLAVEPETEPPSRRTSRSLPSGRRAGSGTERRLGWVTSPASCGTCSPDWESCMKRRI